MKQTILDQDIWVIIPAFQEAVIIEKVVNNLKPLYGNIIVVDDGSDDETWQRAIDAGATGLRHVINLGQGAALRTGIEYALARGAKYICTFDADGQHDPNDLRVLLEKMFADDADIVIGSRSLGTATNMPLARRILLRAAIIFVKLYTGLSLSDPQNGLRIMTRHAAMSLDLRQARMAHATELLYRFSQLDFKIVEAPASVYYTPYSMAKGQTNFGAFTILKDIIKESVLK